MRFQRNARGSAASRTTRQGTPLSRLPAQYVALDLSDRTPEEAILVASATVAADLLVMGAFGTTRLYADEPRGMTNYILENALLPLLLHH